MKYIFLILLSLNLLQANEIENKTVKASELELFLFKIGFQSLLKDVDITKNKSNLNEQELKKLNSKIEIIMDEIYKDKRVINSDNVSSNQIKNVNTNMVSSEEINSLKNEIAILKKQVNLLVSNKKAEAKVSNKNDKVIYDYKAIVKSPEAFLRAKPIGSASIVEVLSRGSEIIIEKCNSFSWCKLKDEEKYIAKYLISKI